MQRHWMLSLLLQKHIAGLCRNIRPRLFASAMYLSNEMQDEGCNVNVTTICMQLLCDLFSGVLVRGLIFFAAAILRLLLNLDMIMGMLNFVLCVLHGNLQLFVDTHIFFVIKANANSMIIIYSYAAVYKSISSTNN